VEQVGTGGMMGGDPETNAAILMHVLQSVEGPARDATVINAGAALYAAGKASDFRAGAQQAAEALRSRAALTTLERLREVSQDVRANLGSAA
jgi:anthranilate phosphoribosyltransferase